MNRIRIIRHALGMSMNQLASAAGVTLISVYRYEVKDRIPDALTAIRMAKALGTTVEDLYPDPAAESQETAAGEYKEAI